MGTLDPLRPTASADGPGLRLPSLASILESERSRPAPPPRWTTAHPVWAGMLLAPVVEATGAVDGSERAAGAPRVGRRMVALSVLGALCVLAALAKGGLLPWGPSTGVNAAAGPAVASAERTAALARALDVRQLRSLPRTTPSVAAPAREEVRQAAAGKLHERASSRRPAEEQPATGDEDTPSDPTGVLPEVDVDGLPPVDTTPLLPEIQLPEVELVVSLELPETGGEVPSLP